MNDVVYVLNYLNLDPKVVTTSKKGHSSVLIEQNVYVWCTEWAEDAYERKVENVEYGLDSLHNRLVFLFKYLHG